MYLFFLLIHPDWLLVISYTCDLFSDWVLPHPVTSINTHHWLVLQCFLSLIQCHQSSLLIKNSGNINEIVHHPRQIWKCEATTSQRVYMPLWVRNGTLPRDDQKNHTLSEYRVNGCLSIWSSQDAQGINFPRMPLLTDRHLHTVSGCYFTYNFHYQQWSSLPLLSDFDSTTITRDILQVRKHFISVC